MMTVLFREEAESDLRAIVEHYETVALESLGKILADIRRSIDQLVRYPRSGMPVAGRTFRRFVTIKYHFKIAYVIGDGQIVILGIFRYQDRQA